MINFTVFGTPVPQGSMRAFMPKGAKHPVVTSDNPKLKSWRQEIGKVAMLAAHAHDCPIPREVGVAIIAVFYFARPKSAKKDAVKVTRPDSDKLLRGVLDSLTGIFYHDDAQVTDARTVKRFGLPERTEIAVGLAERTQE